MDSTHYYCLLNCEDAEKWKGHEKILYEMLHSGARWDHFQCWTRELPSLDSLGKYSGVVISGGHYSAYADVLWIHKLADWLGKAVKMHPAAKFLGVCFGCQILARGLGGEVGKNPSGRFVLKVEEVRITPQLQSDPAYQQALDDIATEQRSAGRSSARGAPDTPPPLASDRSLAAVEGDAGSQQAPSASSEQPGGWPAGCAPTSSGSVGLIRLIQSHGDQVLRLPEGATLLAESDTAAYEMWGWGRNVLAVQGHAELTVDLVMEKIYPAIKAAGRFTPEEAAASAQSLTGTQPDSQLVLRLMRRFMERGLAITAPAVEAATDTASHPTDSGVAVSSQGDTATSAPPSPAVECSQAPTSGSSGGAGGSEDESLEEALQSLSLGVEVELNRGPLELKLLQECNGVAEGHYRHMGQVVKQGNKVLQAVREQQAAMEPALDAISSLDAQVCQLEGVMTHLEATATRLQHTLDQLDKK